MGTGKPDMTCKACVLAAQLLQPKNTEQPGTRIKFTSYSIFYKVAVYRKLCCNSSWNGSLEFKTA